MEEEEINPFRRGSRIGRSPPPPGTSDNTRPTRSSPARTRVQEKKTGEPSTPPKQGIVERELQKCKNTVILMKKAIDRQRNISMDVKNGLSELEEALDILSFHLKPGSTALSQTEASRRQTIGKSGENTERDKIMTPSEKSQAKKRPPSSPLSKESEKKKRQTPSEATKAPSTTRPHRETRPREERRGDLESGPKQHEEQPPKEEEKAPKSRRLVRSRPEAILIKQTGKETYAEILREIRSRVNPDDSETKIKTVRQTKSGHVLLELAANSKGKENFSSSLKSILGEKADIRHLEPRTTLEIRDMDEFTSEEEVESAVKLKLSDPTLNLQVTLMRVNSRAQKLAIIQLNIRAANELLQDPRIKIGWIYCRVRPRVVVARCYRCFGYGHQQATCEGENRRLQGLCFNCGEQGHKKEECRKTAKCYLCAELGLTPDLLAHVPGSGTCRVFREALEKEKGKTSL